MPKIPVEDDDLRNPNRRPGDTALSDADRDWAERERERSTREAEESAARVARMQAFNPPQLGPRPVVPVMGEDLGGAPYERRMAPDEDDPIRDAAPFSPSVWRDEYADPAAPEGGSDLGMGSGGPENKGPIPEAVILEFRRRQQDDQVARDQAATIGALSQAQAPPDQVAKDLQIAQETGANRLDVEVNRKSYELAIEAARIERLRTRSPRAMSWLEADRANLELARDDTENLEWWESAGSMLYNTPGALYAGGVGVGESIFSLGQMAFDAADEMVRSPSPALAALMGDPKEANRIALERQRLQTGAIDPRNPDALLAGTADALGGVRSGLRDYKLGVMPQGRNDIEIGYYSGMVSLATQAPLIAAAAITKNPSIATVGMTASTAGEAYSRVTDEYPDMTFAERAGYALRQAGIEFVTELGPNALIVDALTKGTVKDAIIGGVKSRVAEQLGEQAATALQDLDDWLTLNPEGTWQDYVDARGSAAMQTFVATLVATEGQMAAGKAGVALANRMDAAAQQKRTEDIARMMEAMAQGAAGSKLLKRMPEKYREAVAAITKDGPLETIRVDGEAFGELAQEKGVTVEKLAQAFRIDAAEALTAIEAGHDVVIPAGNYAAMIQTAKKELGFSGETVHQALAPNIRLRADDFTAKEVEAMKKIAADEKAARETTEGETTFADAADRVREDSRKRLAEAGRFNAETTAIQSAVPAELIVTLAERTGQDPEVLWKEYAASVENSLKTEEGELAQGGDRAPIEADDDMVERASQALTEYEFAVWKAAALEGRSNRDIADDPDIAEVRARLPADQRDAMPSLNSVGIVITRARAKGFPVAEAQRGRGDAIKDDVKRLVKLGLTSKQIHERLGRPPELRNSTNAQVSKIKKEMRERGEVLAQEQRGGFTGMNLSQEAVIRLYESANLSTFVHETAHWYLTTLERMARLENPPAFVIEQLASIRNWAGKHPEFEIYDANGQITPEGVEVHESFAETFEAYLREGRAPSTAMRSVFAAFKSWLMRVYRSIVEIGGRVRLDAEITAVFDRALATDEAIAAARKGMDQNAEAMAKAMLDKNVITKRQYERTKARLVEAKEKAEADLMARLMEQYERNQKVWWREEERDIRRDVQSEIDERPEQRAYQVFTGEGWRDTLEDHVERAAQEELFSLNPRSFKAIREASPEDLAAWFDEKVISVTTKGRGTLLRLSSELEKADPSWRIVRDIDLNGESAWTVQSLNRSLNEWEMEATFPTRGEAEQWVAQESASDNKRDIEIKFSETSRDGFNGFTVDMAFEGRLAGVEPSSPKAAREGLAVFNRTVAAIKEHMRRTKPEYVVFTGSGEEQSKLYDFLVRSFSFEGYEGRIEHYASDLIVNDASVFGISDTKVFTLAREDIATQLPINLENPVVQDGQTPGGFRQVSKRYNWTEIVQPPARSAGAPDGGRDQGGGTDAGRDAGAQGELGQSSLPMDEASRMQRAREMGFDVDTPLYHGTTHDFTEFGGKPNIESHHGAGAYFSTSPDDIARNYATQKGQDLTNRIEHRAEQIQQELEDAVSDGVDRAILRKYGVTENQVTARTNSGLPKVEALARELARKELAGGHEGASIPTYARLRNPVITNGGTNPSGLRSQQKPATPNAQPTRWDFETVWDDAGEEVISEGGPALELIDATRSTLAATGMPDKYVDEIAGKLSDEVFSNEGITADAFERIMREEGGYVIDYESSPGQIIQDVYRAMGHDGIILKNAEREFPRMGMNPDTDHYVVFDPKNIRGKFAAFDPSQEGSSKLLAHTGTRKGRVASPPSIPPMRLDLRAVEEQYGPEALAALPPKVRAHSASATDADQFVALARDVQATLKKKHPRSLSKFLSNKRTIGEGNDKISYSGIRDPDGEILAMIGKRNEARGLIATEDGGKKARSYSYEEAAHAAWEEGYFNGDSPPEIAEFLDALRADFDGTAKLYRSMDQAVVQQIDNANEWANWFDQNEIDINEENDAVLRSVIETKLSSQTENAIGPDEAAPFFKMADGRALLEGIKAGPMRDKLIREETRRRMIAKHGDIFNDGTIAQEAAAYARNAAQDRQDEIELEALARAVGQQAATNLRNVTAREMLRDKQVREVLNYNQWLILEQRWMKKALEATEKGKLDKALEYKNYALINRAMFQEGRKLAEKIEKAVKHAKSFDGKDKRIRIGKAGKDYLQQIDQILDGYEFRPVTRKREQERVELRDWFAAKQAVMDPMFDPSGLSEEELMAVELERAERSAALAAMQADANVRNYKSITAEELMAVRDQLDMIERTARRENALLVEGERRLLNLAIDDIEAQAAIATPKELPPESYASYSPKEKNKRGFKQFFSEIRTMQAIVRIIDGIDNGPLARNTIHKLNTAGAIRTARMRLEEDKVVALFREAYGINLKVLRQDQIRFPGIDVPLAKMERLTIALYWGTEISRRRIMDGYGWDQATVQNVLNSLDQTDWRFVKSVWDYVDSLYPEATKAHEDVHGVPLAKQPGLPIMTRFGVIEGSYFPIKYNPHQSSRADQQALTDTAKQITGRAGTRKATGSTKERVKGKVTMPVLLDFYHTLASHVNEVVDNITMQRAVLDAGRIIAHPRTQQIIVKRHGWVTYKTLMGAMKDTRNGLAAPNGPTEQIAVRIRNGATNVTLGLNPGTVIKQLIGFTATSVRLGGPRTGAIGGLGWMLRGAVRMGFGAKGMQNGVAFILERSPYMKVRMQVMNQAILDQQRRINEGNIKADAKRAIDVASFFMLQRVQFLGIDAPTWLGAYEKFTSSGMSDADAAQSADQVVIDAQGSGEIWQVSAFQRGGPIQRIFTNYITAAIANWNLAVNTTRGTNFRNPGQAAIWAMNMGVLMTVPVILSMAVAHMMSPGGEEDDEPLEEQFIREQISWLLGPLGLFGQMSGAAAGFAYKGPQGTRWFQEASKVISETFAGAEKLLAGEATLDDAIDILRPANMAAGVWFGYPAAALDRFVRGADAMMKGDSDSPKALLVGPPRE